MNGVFKQIHADKIIKLAMTLAFILLMLHALYLGLYFFSIPPIIPLYNQMPWGETRLGTQIEIIIPFVITAIFFAANYIFLAKIYSNMPLVSRVLSITTLLAALLSFIFIIRTLQLIL